MKSRLLLHCDAVLSQFTLMKQGETWRRQFTDLKEALGYAGTVVTEETPLVVYNELGRIIIESFVSPTLPE
ncbi:MAG: hypothetical protein ABJF10_06080 [Chthoniobacter sp.]|uniref:hypothetical protein n=1 Tax=Chthoniobacter sp. TaxID=2510640 RepID=UPI0032A6F25B